MSLLDVKKLLEEQELKESKRDMPTLTELEEVAYPDLALFVKVLFDKLPQYDLDMDDKIRLAIKFFRYTAQRPQKLRQNVRKLIGAKPKTMARNLFLEL